MPDSWGVLPLWPSDMPAVYGIGTDRARAAGLRIRPLRDTLADTWEWLRDASRERTAWRQERSEEHTSELQSRQYLVCRFLLGKRKCFSLALGVPCSQRVRARWTLASGSRRPRDLTWA